MNIHRLSFRLALAGAILCAALAFGGRLLGLPVPIWGILAGAAGVGIGMYAYAYRLLAWRIALAHHTLRQIREHEFDHLDAARLPRGDELNALIWQVYRTGQALEREIRELRKMENYRREFIGNVSHELKTPIFTIRGFAETLLDGALEDEQVNRSFVEKILRNADRLSNLARDLSQIAEIETGELQMTAAPFDLRKLVREVIESMELAAENKSITLRPLLPSQLPPAIGDRERVRQVLTNLIDNAIKYNNPGGTVEVGVRTLPSDKLEVKVMDDGIGISPEHLERLTERFFRVDQSRSRDQGGTGLGLAIVKHILNAHGSQLFVDSTPGEGSTFGFRLRAKSQG